MTVRADMEFEGSLKDNIYVVVAIVFASQHMRDHQTRDVLYSRVA